MSITKTPTSMIDPNGATAGQVLTFNGSTSAWGVSSLSANGFSVSLSSNGYQKLPSGLITQWGVLSSVALDESKHVVTFPISFPNSVFNVTATLNYDVEVSGSIGVVVKSLSSSGFQVYGDHATITTTGNIFWQAIGY